MCGLAGILLYKKQRSETELDYTKRLFTELLINSEHRGPYATGAAIINGDNGSHVDKVPLPASRYVCSPGYDQLMDVAVDECTAIMMGHTRWPTRGSHLDNTNNQPLCSDGSLLCITHNGHVKNADELSASLRLPREWEVDSEILLRIAERHIIHDGVETDSFLRDIALIKGKVSAVIASPQWANKVYLLKGNQPLFMWWNRKMKMLAYASEQEILSRSITDTKSWQDIPIPAWRLVTVTLDKKPELEFEPFSLAGDVNHVTDSYDRN
ncbi:MAG: class II glutamine amidotransferase [Armatimonadota bacterium]